MSTARKDEEERLRLEGEVARRALPLIKDNPVRAQMRARYGLRLAEGDPPASVLEQAQIEAALFANRVFAQTGAPACASGCSHCCEGPSVGVNATEARALADHLRRLPAEDLELLRARVVANAARARATSPAPKMTCALLGEDRRCSVYALRPLTCRGAHSFNAESCRRATAGEEVGIPVDARVVGIYSEVATAFREATAGFGGDVERYELHQALDILLADADGDLGPARSASDPQATRAAQDAVNAALARKAPDA